MKKIIIAGSRDFEDLDRLKYECNNMITSHYIRDIEVVSGCAKGTDTLARRYAEYYGHVFTGFPADWDTHGKAAGPIRNQQMAEYADGLIAFWDTKSRGTLDMIRKAKKAGLDPIVVIII